MTNELLEEAMQLAAQIACGEVVAASKAYEALRSFLSLHLKGGDGWQPIETAPRGSGENGPTMVTHPDYVEPPKLLLWTSDGPVVGYYDWYYHEGYGRGWEPGVAAWRNTDGGPTYDVTHWMPLPQPPAALTPSTGSTE